MFGYFVDDKDNLLMLSDRIEQAVKQSVRQVIFGFQENLLIFGPAGCGKSTKTMDEIHRHDAPHIHLNCSTFTDDHFWEFKKILMEDDDRLIVLDEANGLPPRLAELLFMWVEVYNRKGIIALAQSHRKGGNPHLCLSEFIPNQVTLSF